MWWVTYCPFGGEEGTKHFTNKAQAQEYSEKRIKAVGTASHGRLKRRGNEVSASNREEARVRSSLELLYGGLFTQDQLGEVGGQS